MFFKDIKHFVYSIENHINNCLSLLQLLELILYNCSTVCEVASGLPTPRGRHNSNHYRGSVYELDRQTKCQRTGSVTELDEIELAFLKNAYSFHPVQ